MNRSTRFLVIGLLLLVSFQARQPISADEPPLENFCCDGLRLELAGVAKTLTAENWRRFEEIQTVDEKVKRLTDDVDTLRLEIERLKPRKKHGARSASESSRRRIGASSSKGS